MIAKNVFNKVCATYVQEGMIEARLVLLDCLKDLLGAKRVKELKSVYLIVQKEKQGIGYMAICLSGVCCNWDNYVFNEIRKLVNQDEFDKLMKCLQIS